VAVVSLIDAPRVQVVVLNREREARGFEFGTKLLKEWEGGSDATKLVWLQRQVTVEKVGIASGQRRNR
jgi:hypothetical protein